jgi:hypothetical protein
VGVGRGCSRSRLVAVSKRRDRVHAQPPLQPLVETRGDIRSLAASGTTITVRCTPTVAGGACRTNNRVHTRQMEQTLASRQAFEAMRRFLAQFNEREPPERRETIESILTWTEIEQDGGTSDPAQWHDWEQAVASVIGSATEGS